LIIRRRKDMKVGQQVSFENEDIYNVRGKRFLYVAAAVSSVAAVLVVMFLYFQSAFLSNTDNIYGYICVDINPSVELVIDETCRVLEVRPQNKDGEQLISGLELLDKNVEDVVYELINRSISFGFVKADDNRKIVLISGALNDKRNELKTKKENDEAELTELLDNIKARVDRIDNIKVRTITATSRERKDALKYGLSMGKYCLYLEAQELNGSITIDEVHDMSISDMIEKLEQMKLALKDEASPKLQTTPTLGGETAQISPESMQHSTVPGLPETPSSSEKTIAPTLHGTPGVPDEKTLQPSTPTESSEYVQDGTKGLKIQYYSRKPMIPQGSTSASECLTREMKQLTLKMLK